jgi:hypothetical protein
MPRENNKKETTIAIAIIGLIGTAITAIFGSPVLVEWIKSRQATAAPPAIVTQAPEFTEQILIFREDFDNDAVSGFAYVGTWQVVLDRNNRILETTGPGTATFGPSDFTNGIIEFRAQIQSSTGGSMAAVNFRNSGNESYALALAENQLVLGQRENNSQAQAFNGETTRSLVFEKGVWYLIRVEVRGSEMIVFVDNNRIMSANNNQLIKGGLSFSVDEGMQVAFDDVRVWELK